MVVGKEKARTMEWHSVREAEDTDAKTVMATCTIVVAFTYGLIS